MHDEVPLRPMYTASIICLARAGCTNYDARYEDRECDIGITRQDIHLTRWHAQCWTVHILDSEINQVAQCAQI